MSSLSAPTDCLRHGLFWFMNLTAADAKAFLAQGGDLLDVRKIWEDGE